MTPSVLVRDATLHGRRVDVRCAHGVVVEVTDAGTGTITPGTDVVDARGGAVLPGLHDHHLHLLAMAAATRSVPAGPPQVQTAAELIAALRAADRVLPPGAWLRAVGYHESVAGSIDGDWLDAIGLGRPVRVQHRTGALWILNTAGLFAIGLGGRDDPVQTETGEHVEVDATGRPTGRLFRADRLLRTSGRREPDDGGELARELGAVGERLASLGITGVTDLTPTTDPSTLTLLAAARRTGTLSVRVVVTGAAGLSPDVAPELPRGPVKIVIDDHELPPFDRVLHEFTQARATGRTIAVHSVTRESIVLALAAWREVGTEPGDRVEHGAVIPVELLADLTELGLTVVTQPSFVHERGDHYLSDVDVHDVPHLWRCRSLLDAGIAVAFGSDAPYGDPDPWAAIRTATTRRTRTGAVLGPGERIGAASALHRFMGTASEPTATRTVAAGEPADLCVLDRSLDEQLAEPDANAVLATIVGGGVVHHR